MGHDGVVMDWLVSGRGRKGVDFCWVIFVCWVFSFPVYMACGLLSSVQLYMKIEKRRNLHCPFAMSCEMSWSCHHRAYPASDPQPRIEPFAKLGGVFVAGQLVPQTQTERG
jgi:hypothetical protein